MNRQEGTPVQQSRKSTLVERQAAKFRDDIDTAAVAAALPSLAQRQIVAISKRVPAHDESTPRDRRLDVAKKAAQRAGKR